MDRSKVICHMYLSIDGKIDGKYMDATGREISGDYYDIALWEMGNANGSGSQTAYMYFANSEVDYSSYDTSKIDYYDNIIKSDYYWVVYDRRARCNWDINTINYGGKDALIVMVLTKNAPKSYLAHLRKLGIAYIICGTDDIDLELSLNKLKKLFGIDTLVLCGGAVINGAFHKKGLLDELSIVMAPFIEGDNSKKNYLETDDFINTKYVYKSIKPLSDGGIHLMFKKEK